MHDRAGDEPERLARMVDRWWEEAARYDVLPLDNRILFTILNPRPNRVLQRTRYRYLPHGAPVPESVAVDVRNRSHEITAHGRGARRRHRRRCAARPRVRVGRMVVARARRSAALRAQPLRQVARRHRRRWCRRRGPPHARIPLREGRRRGRSWRVARRRRRRRHRRDPTRSRPPATTTPARGSAAGTSSGRRWGRVTRRRSGSPARSTRSWSTSPASLDGIRWPSSSGSCRNNERRRRHPRLSADRHHQSARTPQRDGPGDLPRSGSCLRRGRARRRRPRGGAHRRRRAGRSVPAWT